MLDLNLAKSSKKKGEDKKTKKSVPKVRASFIVMLLVAVLIYFGYSYILPLMTEKKTDYSELVPKVEIDSTRLKEALERQKQKTEEPKQEDKPEVVQKNLPETKKPEKPEPVSKEEIPFTEVYVYDTSVTGFKDPIRNFLEIRDILLPSDFYNLISITENKVISEFETGSKRNADKYKNLIGKDVQLRSFEVDFQSEGRYVLYFTGNIKVESTHFDNLDFNRYYSSKLLIDNLKENAVKNNLKIEKIREREGISYKSRYITPVIFKVSGKDNSIIEFLKSIENLKWNINIRKLSAVSRYDKDGLNTQLVIDFDVISE